MFLLPSKRWIVAVLLAVLWGGALPSVMAQAPPDDVINPILRDLSQRVGRTLTLDDLANYSWSQAVYNDDSLGCPSPDTEYTRSFVQGYRVTITYGQLFWDYRYDAGNNTFFLCNNPDLDRLVLPVTVTPFPSVTNTPIPTATPTVAPPTSTLSPQQATQAQQGNFIPPAATATRAAASTPLPRTEDGFYPCEGQSLTGDVPSRLGVGVSGRFVGAGTQTIYAEASRTAQALGTTQPNNTFSVVGGPTCGRTFVWWQVDTEGLVGWVGEINPSDLSYWLQPTGDVPLPSATPASESNAVVPSALLVDVLAEQTLTANQTLLTGVTDQNPEGVAVLIGGGVLNVFSNTSPGAPLFTYQDVPQTPVAALINGDTEVLLLGEATAITFSTVQEDSTSTDIGVTVTGGSAVLPDLNLVAVGSGNAVLLYDPATQEAVADIPLDGPPLNIASSATQNLLAIMLADAVVIYDASTRTELSQLPITASQGYGLAFSPDGGQLAVSDGAAGSATVYNVLSQEAVGTLAVYTSGGGEVVDIVYSPDGRYIAIAGGLPEGESGPAAPVIQVWNVADLSPYAVLNGVEAAVSDIGYSADGELLNALRTDGVWQIWLIP